MTISAQHASSDGRIPVTLLTGFLGAGKTTLLNALVKSPDFRNTAVLINEFGAVGIDHHLVENLGESMVLLESGCVCCAMRGDLVAALRDLHERLSRRQLDDVQRVIIETTGVADPVPVVATLMEERFVSARFRCDGIVTLIDASHGAAQLDRHSEARRQVALADRIFITKSDLADRGALEELHSRLGALNPAARCTLVSHGEVDTGLVTGAGVYMAGEESAQMAQSMSSWLGQHEDEAVAEGRAHDEPALDGQAHPGRGAPQAHGADVSSFTLHFGQAVPWRGFAVTMGQVLAEYGAGLMRVKGLMNVAGLAGPVVVQCVEETAYPPLRLPMWPADKGRFDMRGRLVFITHGLSPAAVVDIRERLMNLPDDAQALRKLATCPLLPTRCWLAARIPVRGRGSFETDGFMVSPVRMRRMKPFMEG
ncbi:CobW family GTP-binding protein [Xanthobacter sp. TB0139]|uniref:CobW family GTP-binding protein n=1 Tax=Xanthobacter sp. TB0139 TaxID=3459178 RepID=UPI004039BCCB